MRLLFIPWKRSKVMTDSKSTSTSNKYIRRKIKMGKGKQKSKEDQQGSAANLGVMSTLIPSVTNVHYASAGVPGFSSEAYKYPVNHYEVALSINPGLTNSDDLISENSGHIVNIGGREFHRKVVAAADYARANYLTMQGVGDSTELIQAFYDTVLNSRTIYSLLLTAHRCQNMVNCVDEDNIFINYLFASRSSWAPQSASSLPYLSVTANTYVARSSRQGMCFSSSYSNAEWKGLWEEAQTCLYLPENWKKQCEHLFSGVFACLPNRTAQTPTFVTLWPSAFITTSDTTLKSNVEFLENYYSTNASISTAAAGNAFGSANATIAQLKTFIEKFIKRVNYLKGQFPELELMFKYLGINQDITFDFTRDLAARSIKVDYTTQIAEVIYNAAIPRYFYNPNSLPASCGMFSGIPLNRNFESCFLNLDPVFKSQKRELEKSLKQDANFVYEDVKQQIPHQALSLVLHKAMAPLAFRVLKRQSGVANFISSALGRMFMEEIGSFMGHLTAATETQRNNYSCYSLFSETNSYVLPRTAFNYNPPLVGGAIDTTSDYFRFGVLQTESKEKYYLRDYLVPQITAEDVMLSALDNLSCSVSN